MGVKMLSPSPDGHEVEDAEISVIQPNYYQRSQIGFAA